jgi:hypothetical protein
MLREDREIICLATKESILELIGYSLCGEFKIVVLSFNYVEKNRLRFTKLFFFNLIFAF